MTIFTDYDTFKRIFDSNMSNLSPKLQNDIVIKILVDNYDGQIENQIELLNGKYRKSPI